MKISKNKFVSLSYELNVGEGEERELMERTTDDKPLQFIYGTGTMLPAFEENLRELEAGGKFSFSISSDKAYGEFKEEHVVELPKKIFEVEGKFDNEYVKEGATLPMMDSNGNHMNGSVLDVNDDVVIMDFNHPLAGETLHFTGEVLDVHEPTEEELASLQNMHGGGCNCENCGDCGDQKDDHGCGCGCCC
jgi:FKBP-type peptidyl-prolyl cis-trans isomerase SlyD